MRAEALVRHLVEPLVAHPDAVRVNEVEGEAVTIVELTVHPEDRALFEGEDGNLRAVRNVLSAAAGARKATVELTAADDEGEE